MASSHTLDQLDTCFDDTHAVANAGLLLAATLAERLGIEQAADAPSAGPPRHPPPSTTTSPASRRSASTDPRLPSCSAASKPEA
jgi:hypothetical protein